MTGADPGAHGRRHGAPRRRDHRHEAPAPAASDRRHEPPTPSEDRQDIRASSGDAEGTALSSEHADRARSQHPVASFFRANPQVLVLLIVCLVLGIGTFLAVLISLATAGSDQTTGEPSGAILGAHAVLASARWLVG